MSELLKTNDEHYLLCISWCVAWSGEKNIFPESMRILYVNYFVKLWIKIKEYNLKRMTSWALSAILIPSFPKDKISKIPKLRSTIYKNYQQPENEYDSVAAIFLGKIVGIDFKVNEIADIFKKVYVGSLDPDSSMNQFIKALGIDKKVK
jgi:hypothetical protein